MLVAVNCRRGFTLVELLMVLFVVGLLLGGLLVPLSTKLEQERRDHTTQYLNEIKELLLGYAIVNGRLPCPDCPDGTVGTCNAVAAASRNDGIGDWGGTAGTRTCNTDVGNLPWTDLQAPEFDGWDRHFTYRVSPNFSRESNTAACGTMTVGVSFELCTPGDIDIYRAYSTPPYPTTPTVADNVPAIVISHGSDAYETAQTNQQVENYDRNPINPGTGAAILSSYSAGNYAAGVFVYGDFSRDNSLTPPTRFDDLIVWLPPSLLMNRMIVSGRLP